MTRRGIWWTCLIALVACAGPNPASAPRGEVTGGAGGGRADALKTLVIGQTNAIKGYGPWSVSSTTGGAASLTEIHTMGLVSEDRDGNPVARVAAKIPSIEDGTIVVAADGRMHTTWKLRPDVKWHNGAALTADDLVFSWEVARHPETTASNDPVIRRAELVEATDPLTLRVTWKSPFYRALDVGHRDFWPFPRDLLAESFQGEKQAFLAHPYFTTAYVNLGPFRLVDFGLGEHQVFERVDDYFLGRPRVHTIVLRTILDPNAMVANLQAGAVDAVAEKALPADLSVQLRDEWQANRGGVLVDRQDNWARLAIQFHPVWADPPELSRNVALRRGLLHAIDRDTLREFVLPGFPDTSGDTFMRSNDPRGTVVGRPFARYPYDLARAAQQLADGGWRRAADGRLLNADGAPVSIEMRGPPTYAKELAIAADSWRQVGVQAQELVLSMALSREPEFHARFPGIDIQDRGSGDGVLPTFDSRMHRRPETRWQGANIAYYVSPIIDRLSDQLYATVPEHEQALLLKEAAEALADDLPALPLYFRVSFAAVRSGIRAIADDYAGTRGSGAMARNAHLWDRD